MSIAAMGTVDLLTIGLLAAAAAAGYWYGLRTGVLLLVGFGVGAIAGSRVAPLVLEGGLHDPYAGVLALPGALLFGALAAAAFERFGFGLRRRLREGTLLDALGGALVAACVGLVAVWIVAAAVSRVAGLRESVRDSTIVDKLNAVLPPPGPLLRPSGEPDSLPVIAGPGPGVGDVRPRIKFDPQVRAAAPSVVKISGLPCGAKGSGWIAGDGIVVTNAHVVQGNDQSGVQIRGKGESRSATAIWYDDVKDIAILRTPGVSGHRSLPIDPNPRAGTFAAALGYPGGGDFEMKAARIGNTTRIPGEIEGAEFKKRIATTMRVDIRGGYSGGPVVDARGRVVGMSFARGSRGHQAFAVPTQFILQALRRADRPVDTGKCEMEH